MTGPDDPKDEPKDEAKHEPQDHAKDEPYAIEHGDEPERPARPPAPLGPADPPAKTTCTECGAAIEPGEPCIRCGIEPGTEEGRVRTPATPAAAVAAETPAAPHGPISPTGRSPELDFWVPVVAGGLALLILIISHLAGVPGLFPQVQLDEAERVPILVRFVEILRMLVLAAFWIGCGLAGLFALSLMEERPLGEARLATVRLAAIILIIRLATLISVPGPRWVEWMTETVLQGAGFILLAIVLFRMALRNAAIFAAWTLMAILLLWLFTYAVQWALTG